ncbi:alanine/glycine:cation symporter family protein [Isachenkonia alkalipeptolytica]|uniref:Sodium:alanine symporter family protein n=1 Tax=Isachenkonia alkalipeptolytica TaxID=2565777 RepID=A0AA44BCW8_9CLOT|nr:sodium:alanine symporter family protein [Isachenkonia alkalipeptolytica]NBG87447.1 sodium:alanine symporter family protein [Isachenkonia alkalipeptolytica]
MDAIINISDFIGDIVWGPPFLVLLIATGLYLTIRIGFFQFTHLGHAWKYTFGSMFRKGKEEDDAEAGAITSFQSVSSAMAATIGVGNIAGVATAIYLGGPGAVFWMWLSALVGMATKFGEASLGVKFRNTNPDGSFSGGVMQYIENGLGSGWKWLSVLYAIFAGLAALGIGNMVQSNTVAVSMEEFGIEPWITGIVIVVLVGLVTLGGIERIAKTAEKVVPTMAVIYIVGSFIILVLNLTEIPAALGDIFYYAFNPNAAAAGGAGVAVGTTIRFGIARGVFSNEAGLGAASIVHAQAKNSPTRQGMWGIWEVFIDTIIVCTMTSLVILTTGALGTGETGADLTTAAFNRGLPGPGGYIILISIVFFAYTTMLTWNFYGEKSWEYIFGRNIVIPYRLLFLAFLFVGAVGGLEVIWGVADTLNGLMIAPNLVALILLGGALAKEKQKYMDKHNLDNKK